jgi:hypothetical protein
MLHPDPLRKILLAAGINTEGEAKVREALRSPSQTGIVGE